MVNGNPMDRSTAPLLQTVSRIQATRHALKEWAVAVDSLRDGDTMLTVRKGGIREDGREFRMEHHVFAFFPTFEHQNATQIGERQLDRLQRVTAGVPNTTVVRVNAWAEVTDAIEVTSQASVEAVARFSVFSPSYAIERLQWRPKKPLHVLVLRVHRLSQSSAFDLLPGYGGCKSWIDLAVEIPLQPSVPALDDAAFEAARARVLAALDSAL
jgi:hypothetical protein